MSMPTSSQVTRDWAWQWVERSDRLYVPCWGCGNNDLQRNWAILYRDLLWCWPCAFGRAADTGKAARGAQPAAALAAPPAIWTP